MDILESLNQVKFVPGFSQMAISERSLSIMEYLNRELDFVDPVEFKNLKVTAKILQRMANEGIHIDERPGQFSGTVNMIHAIAMSEQLNANENEHYRVSDCISSGRPRVFPPGSLMVSTGDFLEYEVITDHGVDVNRNSVRDLLAEVLGEDLVDSRGVDMKESMILNKWISSYRNLDEEQKTRDRDKFSFVMFFLEKNVTKPLWSEETFILEGYDIDDENVRDILRKYLIEKTEKDRQYVQGFEQIRIRQVVRKKVCVIDVLMLGLDKRVRSSDFKAQHPIVQASEVYLRLIDIHPFSDGNERTARLLMNYYLMMNNLPVFEVYPDNRKEFIKAVRFIKTKNEFAVFLAEQLLFQNQFMIRGSDDFLCNIPR